ncbi:MAG: HDIG domain-containing protein [Bacteroidales bacterium]|jgi:putative nucleotidyltransferase with HDIG domain|nr:HDIG domain-containing protein [Bacteroidales bacterium]MDD4214389.1 HDIG domain-containing protein [Bacteroidales bacterium]
MSSGITREKAFELLQEYIKKENMINHCLASEAVMKALARRLGEDDEKWGIAGLLHDIDVEITNADPKTHGQVAIDILINHGVDPEIIEAISLHNEVSAQQPRTTVFHHALAAGETITGLIIATTLVYPEKKLFAVKSKSVVKRMKEKAFAASVKRETIMECELIGLPIAEFAEISVNTMQEIAAEIGL